MWKPYLKVVAQRAQGAIQVLDRFHVMAKLSKAIDEVRAQEAREMAAAGEEPALKNTRWLLVVFHFVSTKFFRLFRCKAEEFCGLIHYCRKELQ